MRTLALVPIIVFIFMLFYPHRKPELFFVAVTHLTRLTFVILLTPAAYFKYVTSFWLVGSLLLIYKLAELDANRGFRNTQPEIYKGR